MLSKLSKLSEEYNVEYFTFWSEDTNVVVDCYIAHESSSMYVHLLAFHLTFSPKPFLADPGATMTFVAGGALKPIGGHILSHASATRMFLRKGLLEYTHLSLLNYAI